MDWTIKPFAEANHNPQLTVNGQNGTAPILLDVEVGKPITLDASASRDPDGHKLSFRWFYYEEAGFVGGRDSNNARNSHIYYDLGLVLDETGRAVEAEDALKQAVECTPRDAALLRTLPLRLEKNRKPADARTVLQQLLSIEPDDANAKQDLRRLAAAATFGKEREKAKLAAN
ncbi:MAG: hypothetical protein JNK38_12160 [Acidobacteria bacterium]|nr:hypothetical protein [Acidobacteriota bacterium]